MLSGVLVRKLSMQMTSSPSARNRSQRCEPMKPAPPVMSTRAIVCPQPAARTGPRPMGKYVNPCSRIVSGS